MQFRYSYHAILNKICNMPSSSSSVAVFDTPDLLDDDVVNDEIFVENSELDNSLSMC